MSVSFGFYNSVNGDRVYDAIDMGRIFDGIIRDGVFQNYDDDHHIFGVTAVSGNALKFKVDIGRAWFDHTWILNDAPLTLTLSKAPSTYGRWDAIVLDINIGARTNNIIVVTGTDVDSNPSKPAMIKTASRKQYPLAYIYMTANTTKATDCTIQNAVGTSACPFVTAPLDKMNIDSLLSEWRTEWATARSRIEQQYGTMLATLVDSYLQNPNSELYDLIVNHNAQLAETVAGHSYILGHLTQNFPKVFFYQEYAQGDDPGEYYYGILAETIGASAMIRSLRDTGGMVNAFRPSNATVIVGDILLSSSGKIGRIDSITRHAETDKLVEIEVVTVGTILSPVKAAIQDCTSRVETLENWRSVLDGLNISNRLTAIESWKGQCAPVQVISIGYDINEDAYIVYPSFSRLTYALEHGQGIVIRLLEFDSSQRAVVYELTNVVAHYNDDNTAVRYVDATYRTEDRRGSGNIEDWRWSFINVIIEPYGSNGQGRATITYDRRD